MARKPQQGLTLVEVMVALLVMSSGVLAGAGLQWKARQGTDSALVATQAAWLAAGAREHFRASAGMEAGELQRSLQDFAGPSARAGFQAGAVSLGWDDSRIGGGWRVLELGGAR